ncbi:hypothetical protein Tco_0274522, partial [Tanacetum coccineum]
GDSFPQRHVAGESPDMSPGKRAIVVVCHPSLAAVTIATSHHHFLPSPAATTLYNPILLT